MQQNRQRHFRNWTKSRASQEVTSRWPVSSGQPSPRVDLSLQSSTPESLLALTRWPKSLRTLGTRLAENGVTFESAIPVIADGQLKWTTFSVRSHTVRYFLVNIKILYPASSQTNWLLEFFLQKYSNFISIQFPQSCLAIIHWPLMTTENYTTW